MSDHESLIAKFCNLSGISAEEAKHMLEAFQWNYDEAVRAHYENEDDNSGDIFESFPEPQSLQTNTGNSGTGTSRRIATLNTIRTEKPEESEDEECQAFYVGGSETGGGGQQVLGPPRKREQKPSGGGGGSDGGADPPASSDVDYVHRVFQTAKKMGAEVLNASRFSEEGEGTAKQVAFSGTGYRLGEDVNAPSCVEPSPVSAPSTSEPGGRNVVVKMWQDGFSLDDGPLRPYTDPASRAFMDDIQAGHVPQELTSATSGGLVNLLLEDHHNEAWKAPPPKKMKPFSGTGVMLGHPVPPLVATGQLRAGGGTASEPAPPCPEVDASQPVTQVMVRLPENGRITVRLNHSHTVNDLRQAIISQRPALATTTFSMFTTFPKRELSNDRETLEQAKLINSAVIVSLS